MSINLHELVTLDDAAKLVPGRLVTMQTIKNWVYRGIKGVHLKTWKVGGRVMTTPTAIEDFIKELSAK